MFDLIAAGASEAIRFEDLGLTKGIDLGFFTLRFYSLAYLAGIMLAWWQVSRMIKAPGAPMAQRHVDDLFFYCTLGVIIGGRLGYATFYRPELFTGWVDDAWIKWELLRLTDGGMSFHGGLIGTTVAMFWVSWRDKLSFIRVCDYVSVTVGFGMFFGRLANFINGELWGRPVHGDLPWAMVFPGAGEVARHPSQLYEALLEGALLLAVMLPLFWYTRARYRPGLLVGVFGTMICAARFVVEFFREPDEHLAWMVVETGLSRGQWLSIPLILMGIGLIVWALVRPELGSARKPAEA